MSNSITSYIPDAAVEGVMREAASAFVEAFFAKVPFYTGASRGQIAQLAADAGILFTGPVTASSRLDRDRLLLEFPVDHFLVNESNDATQWGVPLKHPGPYNAIPAALAAADEVMTAAAERLLAAAVDDLLMGITL